MTVFQRRPWLAYAVYLVGIPLYVWSWVQIVRWLLLDEGGVWP